MATFFKKIEKDKKGNILLITLMILTSVLVVTLGVANLIIPNIAMNRTQSYSLKAYFASETGAEKSLWSLRKGGLNCATNNQCIDFSQNTCVDCPDLAAKNSLNNGSSYSVEYASSTLVTLKSSGSYLGARRTVEVQVGAPFAPSVPTCQSNCDGKECGDDGCGGSCDSCVAPKTCIANNCETYCPPNLVSYWKMDGNWNDSAWFNDIASTSATFGPGKHGSNSAQFDGNNWAVISNNPSIDLDQYDSITIEAWVYHVSGQPQHIWTNDLLNNKNFVGFEVDTVGSINVWFYGDGDKVGHGAFFTGMNSVISGAWNHVAFTHTQGMNPKIYSNGQSVPVYINLSWGGERYRQTDNTNIFIGRSITGWNNYTTGYIDEVALYYRELSPGEIEERALGDSCVPTGEHPDYSGQSMTYDTLCTETCVKDSGAMYFPFSCEIADYFQCGDAVADLVNDICMARWIFCEPYEDDNIPPLTYRGPVCMWHDECDGDILSEYSCFPGEDRTCTDILWDYNFCNVRTVYCLP